MYMSNGKQLFSRYVKICTYTLNVINSNMHICIIINKYIYIYDINFAYMEIYIYHLSMLHIHIFESYALTFCQARFNSDWFRRVTCLPPGMWLPLCQTINSTAKTTYQPHRKKGQWDGNPQHFCFVSAVHISVFIKSANLYGVH